MESHDQDDNFTGDKYNQLENFLMEDKEFRLPELLESNRSNSNNNPITIQQGESNRVEMTEDQNHNRGDVTNVQHNISLTGNNECPPSKFIDHMAQSKNISAQWSSPTQTSSLAKPVPPPAPATGVNLAKYSNPIQPQMSNIVTTTYPSPTSASTDHQLQTINNPPQTPCNNNDIHLEQVQQIITNNGGYQLQLATDRYTLAVADKQPVANNASSSSSSISSSIAYRFAAAAQGATMGTNKSTDQYPLSYGAPPSSQGLFMSSQQQCVSYVQGGAHMDAAAGGYGVVQPPFPSQMTVAGGGGGGGDGGLETRLLPMYSTGALHDLALMNKSNNSSIRKNHQLQEVPAGAKKPRGRPKGSVSKKRNPPPQWEDVRYDMHELQQHAKKPYNVRRAEWHELKQAGVLTAASRAQMMMMSTGSLPPAGDGQKLAVSEGVQADVDVVDMNNDPSQMNIISLASYDMQGQNGNLPAAPASADSGMLMSDADQNPSKFWSFGTNYYNGIDDQNTTTVHVRGLATFSESPETAEPSSSWNIIRNNPSSFSSYEDAAAAAAAVGTQAQGDSSINTATSIKTDNQQAAVADQYSISVSDYFSDGMLTDDDFMACALREQLIARPIAQPNQQQQVTPQQNALAPAETWGVSQSFSGNNNHFFNIIPPSQPDFQQNTFGRASGHQAYTQQSNTTTLCHQKTMHQNIPRTSGPTDFFYYHQRPRPFAMPPPPGPQSGYMINTPLMQQCYYQYGATGEIRPPKTPRRCRMSTRPSVIDFNQCAVTPIMFNEIVNDGSVDTVLGSELWTGLNQDAYNIMVMADPTPLVDTSRLQERIAQINSGILPVPNLLNSLQMDAAGYSAPMAANRLMGNSNMMNIAPPTAMLNAQQGHGVATDAVNYNFPDPNAGVPPVMMNANYITSVQNQQPHSQPNFGYWHEYPSAPSSGQKQKEMTQLVPWNKPSVQENVNYNHLFSSFPAPVIPQLQHAAPSPVTLQVPNQAYNDTMYGVQYTSGGPHM